MAFKPGVEARMRRTVNNSVDHKVGGNITVLSEMLGYRRCVTGNPCFQWQTFLTRRWESSGNPWLFLPGMWDYTLVSSGVCIPSLSSGVFSGNGICCLFPPGLWSGNQPGKREYQHGAGWQYPRE